MNRADRTGGLLHGAYHPIGEGSFIRWPQANYNKCDKCSEGAKGTYFMMEAVIRQGLSEEEMFSFRAEKQGRD